MKKLKAMTCREYCDSHSCNNCDYRVGHNVKKRVIICNLTSMPDLDIIRNTDMPFKTKQGKYIMKVIK